MSQATTEILLPQTVFAGTNYTVTGVKKPAASFYIGNKSLQTVSWGVLNMTGNLLIQTSLVTDPQESDWVTYTTINYVGASRNDYLNVIGSYVWIRVQVTGFIQGDVQYVKVSY